MKAWLVLNRSGRFRRFIVVCLLLRRTDEDDVIHQDPVLSAGGRFLAYASNSRSRQFFDVWVADLEEGTARLAWAIDGWLAPIAWSNV